MREAPQSGQVVVGKYRVRECLGTGGMGAVYKAENLITGKRVALKWLHPHLVNEPGHSERFMREARVLAKIRHPNVVDLYDVGRDHESFFLVLEFLEGESLGARLDRSLGPIPETLQLLVDGMRGVAAAHKEGIIHRDLKPDNIFLARESDDGSLTPKLLDFGISKFALPQSGQVKLTKTGSIFGTPRYMSYEQLMGRDVDARTDVYSFGVILYEALTGRAPYPASNFQHLLVQISALKPALPRSLRPEIPRELERVIMSTLSHDRTLRPPSMEALIEAVKPFRKPVVTGHAPPAREAPRPLREPRAREQAREAPQRARPPREVVVPVRSPWKPALVAVAICVSAGVGWVMASRDPRPDAELHEPAPPAALPILREADVMPKAAAEQAEVGAAPDASVVASTPLIAPPAARLVPPKPVVAPKPVLAPQAVLAPQSKLLEAPVPARSDPMSRRRTPSMRAEEF
jgi:serine/threonine protein kinase